MNTRPEPDSPVEFEPVRRPYAKPELKRVDLALAETLSEGCKLESDPGCVGPPVQLLDGGS